MDWREERRLNLENRLQEVVRLLGEYENDLIYASDPKTKAKLKTQIFELKEAMSNCESDLQSLEIDNRTRIGPVLAMANITYNDITLVISAILNQEAITTDEQGTFQPTKLEEKISKNCLTHEIKYALSMSLPKAREVRHFIENNAKVHYPNLPERLKNALKAEYMRLVNEGFRGDELFHRLYAFSHQNNPNLSNQLAGLAVLCYFFEACDIFEP